MMSLKLSSVVVVIVCILQVIKGDTTQPAKASEGHEGHEVHDHEQYAWLVNHPPHFQQHAVTDGLMIDVKSDAEQMAKFESERQYYLDRPDGHTDGEVIDALDHYFWGMTNGVAMELGGLDGSHETRSMTVSFEEKFKWKRIVVEGNPLYREGLQRKSPLAFGVNAAICSNPSTMHYSPREYVGGLLEFMSQDFLRIFHTAIYQNCTPHGNLSSIDFSLFKDVIPVACIPLSQVLHRAHVKHVNYFVLDVEGGEYEVLKSIRWSKVTFDVLCIETERSNRPPGYEALMTGFMKEKGYIAHTEQKGRNIWFIRDGFIPSVRPGATPDCYLGALQKKECPPK